MPGPLLARTATFGSPLVPGDRSVSSAMTLRDLGPDAKATRLIRSGGQRVPGQSHPPADTRNAGKRARWFTDVVPGDLPFSEPDDGYCSHSGRSLAATPVLAAAAQSNRLPNRTFLPLRPGA